MNTVNFNGQDWPLPEPVTVRTMLERIGLADKRVAVERNGQVVPKSRHTEVVVSDGDRIEIIVAVGGG
ncbi:sulfur carrier protein ThiS [Cognatazoarcus halotolerans]|uniref:sulfur carrier protein ThiS n=1 Tax=Cognatazoarcus halotolerans TaxID=2686016 RepID=UPI001359B6AA|nr:sulfur carrier protein ThiS [Cognatazoarcus halotolerans]MBX3679118.1 sulfur carrier protein ThiS [Rhodocyclaceae bacterium]MCB1898088.1 sulfur carrier protein ThiS [Rhodocyclaceae bacterium]MCP5309220.1 sulfur carrier protein ThiS [Zoogloeaceae bacterium]